jgi:MoaA/NifB/PqqE/SkfB family radical SAM enzyme
VKKDLLRSLPGIARAIVSNRMNLSAYPSFCTFIVTWRCNARCQMCDIWKKGEQDEMTLAQIAQIFSQLPRLHAVRITGGEPFLRSDLTSIVDMIQEKSSPGVVHITTNGLLTEKITDFIKTIANPGNIHLKISIDAVGTKHDEIRGVPGAYQRAMATLQNLSAMRESYHFYLGVDQTIVDSDTSIMQDLREVCDELKVDLHQVIAYAETALYQPEAGLSLLPEAAAEMKTFGQFSQEQMERTLAILENNNKEIHDFAETIIKRYYFKGLRNRLLHDKARPKPRCVALRSHLRILPNGDVPVCLYDATVIGNLTKTRFQDLWSGREINRYRKRVVMCPGCWAGCEVIPNAIYSGDILRALV